MSHSPGGGILNLRFLIPRTFSKVTVTEDSRLPGPRVEDAGVCLELWFGTRSLHCFLILALDLDRRRTDATKNTALT
ncbi:MAG: hypothetical protein OXG88_00290 [Gammaproteobacteria bacterium]|nr:hypothetical protein [Gammaproteobacteria bacterium]